MSETWAMNGIDGATGKYLLEVSEEDVARVARGGANIKDPMRDELRFRRQQESHFGAKTGIDVRDLSQTGWGLVFPAAASPEVTKRQQEIREALAPLLEHRREQASRRNPKYYQEYAGAKGARPGQSKQDWLAYQGIGPGPADPKYVPYYLLLVADPREVPFIFQQQLSVQYAVGRISFDRVEDYYHYAQSVVTAEKQALALQRRLAFFGVKHDDSTTRSATNLIEPLAAALAGDAELAGWAIEKIMAEKATRAALVDLIGKADAPALLFTASHGLGLPKDDPLQLRHQGALLCQDYNGELDASGRVPARCFLAGEDVPEGADLLGTIAFMFACYGAGTPELDEFSEKAGKPRGPIAPYPFVAALPKALLNRPRGGALAVVGHVERAWTLSFMWSGTGPNRDAGSQTVVFESALKALMQGYPIGAAMECFDERYAELSTMLSQRIEDAKYTQVSDRELALLWTANNDARGYAILGDPAVRAMVANGAELHDRAAIARASAATAASAPTAATSAATASAATSTAATPTAATTVATATSTVTPTAATATTATPTTATPVVTATSTVTPTAATATATAATSAATTEASAPEASASSAASVPTSFAIGGGEAPPSLLSEISAMRTEVTTSAGPRVLAQTRIDLRGTIESRLGDPEATSRQLEHHEAMVRAALEQQVELLRILLGRR